MQRREKVRQINTAHSDLQQTASLTESLPLLVASEFFTSSSVILCTWLMRQCSAKVTLLWQISLLRV